MTNRTKNKIKLPKKKRILIKFIVKLYQSCFMNKLKFLFIDKIVIKKVNLSLSDVRD